MVYVGSSPSRRTIKELIGFLEAKIPMSSLMVSLLYQVRTYFQNKVASARVPAPATGECSLDDDEAQNRISLSTENSLTFSHSRSPLRGKFSRGFAKSFSPENSFGKTESAFEFRQFLH